MMFGNQVVCSIVVMALVYGFLLIAHGFALDKIIKRIDILEICMNNLNNLSKKDLKKKVRK